tara:strand:+ start:1219 stop:1515 length:297 start_codon:yes stop_codon:yes gene_type:complete
MPKISRHKDRCKTGHPCTGSAPVNATQYTVFANRKPVLRKGDPVQPHTILVGVRCLMHKAKVRRGSRKVFAKGIGVARRGDSADKGAMTGASQNVVAG